MSKYDIAIIGSGPAGYVAAIKASQLNKKVVLIEEKQLGGVCLNEGCIPTKSLVTSSNFFYKLKKAEEFGINLKNISFDYSKIKNRKDNIVNVLRKNLYSLLLSNKIEILKGRALFLTPKKLKVEDRVIEAEKIIIASGSRPRPFSNLLFDEKLILNSSSILDMETLPKSIAIIGGGYIGLEFASIFNSLEVDVTIIEKESSILPFLDSSISKNLKETLEKRDVKIYAEAQIKEIKIDNKVSITLEDKKVISDKILIATGRVSNIERMNLEGIGIDIKNNIVVSETMQTNIENIYAIGDVTGKYLLAHVAFAQAEVAIDNAFGKKSVMNYEVIPSVIFTNPEIASVGLTSKEAYNKGLDIKETRFPFKALGKSYTDSELEGFVIIISEKKSDKILGGHIIGYEASTMISEIALAIKNGLTLKDIIKTIYAHPTYPEILKEASMLAMDLPLHFFKR